jgi:hypothetical protein
MDIILGYKIMKGRCNMSDYIFQSVAAERESDDELQYKGK